MKLALVHDWLTGMRGGEKCLEVICRRFPDAPLFTLLHRRGAVSPAIEDRSITTSFLQHIPRIARNYRYFLPLMPRAIERLRLPADIDLVVSFSHCVAKSVIPPAGVPHVCYCFTPMRYAWGQRADYFGAVGANDESRMTNDEADSIENQESREAVTRAERRRWKDEGNSRSTLARKLCHPVAAMRDRLLDRIRDWDKATSDRVTHFVAISETVAGRIAQCCGRTSRVIYPPVATEFYTPTDTPREDFYLCVSALVPYKRIDLAIAACQRLGLRLVIIGDGPERKRLVKMLRKSGPSEDSRPTAQHSTFASALLGWRTDEEIRDHLRRCRALLFPGREDFGIVPVEAAACGTPVIAFGQGGATETVIAPNGGAPGSGLFFHEQTAESLAQAILDFEAHPDRFSPAVARRRAEQFATQRFEREFVELLEQVVAARTAPFPSGCAPG